MNEIYLIRHGLIDDKTLTLDSDGINFANDLLETFKDIGINFLASSETPRCVETILPVANMKQLNIQIFNKIEFLNLIPLSNCLLHTTTKSIICYRIEEINPILQFINYPIFTDENRDTAYEKIIHLYLNGSRIANSIELKTGYSKKRNR